MKLYKYSTFHVYIILLFLSLISCSETVKNEHKTFHKHSPFLPTAYKIQISEENRAYIIGDSVELNIAGVSDTLQADNLYLMLPNGDTQKLTGLSYIFSTENFKTGAQKIKLTASFGDTITQDYNVGIKLLSDIEPKKVTYKVIKKYPHNTSSFTQGLQYADGNMYEGTGQYGESMLKFVDLNTGEDIKSVTLPREFFGEGICIYNDKIYQLSWRKQTGFIYDKNSFELIQKFGYSMNEGWGLTFDGKNFILSDGTNKIYFIEPGYFTEVRHLEVCDNKGDIKYLNELEYINGYIFANIWGDHKIAIIDPETGKVWGYLDLKELIPDSVRGVNDKVLNGIAFNPETNSIFVTGKYWPVLYEIKLTGSFVHK